MNPSAAARLLWPLLLLSTVLPVRADAPPLSAATEACLGCHLSVTPGIVADWQRSRHHLITPEQALQQPAAERRYSAKQVPSAATANVVVGCAECHTAGPADRPDAFDHNGFRIHTVVSPRDCAQCHPLEKRQYDDNLMAHARGNLMQNPLYQQLMTAAAGPATLKQGRLQFGAVPPPTAADSCLSCHGTRVEIGKMQTRQTRMGEMSFPALSGWPNQGVGRINPDGSRGACTPCHARHQFSIALARQPATCSQCHKGPDVPAFSVYQVSKHGNIHASLGEGWNYQAVPWTVGRDFSAPTCAACHISGLVDDTGATVAKRTHRVNDRLGWRLFGPIYATPHVATADTTGLLSTDGLPLPAALDGTPDATGLIGADELQKREQRLQRICTACHAGGWVSGHFDRLHHTIAATNKAVGQATILMQRGWSQKAATGTGQGANPFDEGIERLWVEIWLFHAPSARFASAMMGADYGVFAGGRWPLGRDLERMSEELRRAGAGSRR